MRKLWIIGLVIVTATTARAQVRPQVASEMLWLRSPLSPNPSSLLAIRASIVNRVQALKGNPFVKPEDFRTGLLDGLLEAWSKSYRDSTTYYKMALASALCPIESVSSEFRQQLTHGYYTVTGIPCAEYARTMFVCGGIFEMYQTKNGYLVGTDLLKKIYALYPDDRSLQYSYIQLMRLSESFLEEFDHLISICRQLNDSYGPDWFRLATSQLWVDKAIHTKSSSAIATARKLTKECLEKNTKLTNRQKEVLKINLGFLDSVAKIPPAS